MKKKLLLFPFIAALIYVTMCSDAEGGAAVAHTDGTGATSPGGCSCHNVSPSSTTMVAIELDSAGIPVTSYVAGGSYTIKISGTNTGATSLPKFGFQVTAVKSAGAGTGSATNAGTLATTGLPPNCQNTPTTTSGLPIVVVEQSAALAATTGTGATGTTYVESIPWTAPATTGTGSIKLYGVINAVNGNGTDDAGDLWNHNNATLTEGMPPITGTSTVCVGSTTSLSDLYAGGTWGSTNTAIATVNSSGVVTGLTPGTDVITDGSTLGTVTYTVTVVAAPTSGTITATTDSVCQGATITLTHAGGTPGGTWSSSASGIASVGPTGVVRGVSTTGGTTANIMYTVTNGCGSAATTYSVNVKPLPNPGTISGAPFVCSSAPATYTATATGGTWSMINGNAAISTGGVVTVLATGFDTIYYSVTNGCGTVAAQKAIAVTLTPTVTPISGPTTLCTGSNITLIDTTSGGTWTSGTPGVATVSASGVVHGLTTGSTTIKYKIANFCGSDSATYVVTVGLSPSAGTITGPTGMCAGTTITLADGTGGGTWSITNGNATQTGGSVTGVTAGLDTVKYSVTNSCGTATAIYPITISNSPDAGAISGADSVCQGAQITLSETAAGGTWSSASTGTIASVNASGVVTGVSGSSDIIVYSVANGCGTVTATYPVTVSPLPDAGMISGPSVMCVGTADTLTDTVSGGVWSVNDTNVSVVNGVVTATSAGIDTVAYSVTNSCGTAAAIYVIGVSGGTNAGTILGDSSLCIGAPIIITDSLPGGSWTLSNGNALVSSSSFSSVIAGVTPGLDTVTYSILTSCGVISSSAVLTIRPESACWPAAVAAVTAVTALNVYPNPSAGVFTLSIPQVARTAEITVTDLTGRIVVSRTADLSQATTVSLDLHTVATGNYLLKVKAGSQVYREKITISK